MLGMGMHWQQVLSSGVAVLLLLNLLSITCSASTTILLKVGLASLICLLSVGDSRQPNVAHYTECGS